MGYNIRMRNERNSIECCRTCLPESEGGKRHIGCHGTCEEYIKAKSQHEDEKDKISKAKSYENEHVNYMKTNAQRRRRAHR